MIGGRTEYSKGSVISYIWCRAQYCKKKSVPCIREWTNSDGTIIMEWCEDHEKEVHELPGYAH